MDRIRFLNIKTKLNREDRFNILLVLVWTRLILVSYIYQVMLLIPGLNSVAEYIKVAVYIIATLFALPYFVSIVKIRDICWYLIICLIYYLNLSVFPNTTDYLIKNAVNILLIVVPAYFMGLGLIKKEQQDLLYFWSKVCIIAICIHFVVFGLKAEVGSGATAENMGLAYRILPHLCLVFIYAVKDKKIKDWIYTFVSFFLLLACGTRGAVLCALVMSIAVFLSCGFNAKKIALSAALLTAIGLIYAFFDQILGLLSQMLGKLNLSMRIIEGLAIGNISDSNGRDEIADYMMRLLANNSWKGYGIAGDRGWVSWMAYSHNICIEFLVSFGVVIGGFLIAAILYLAVKSFIDADSDDKLLLIAMFFGGGVFKLFFSSSYLLEFQFFMYLGLCVNIIREKKYERICADSRLL